MRISINRLCLPAVVLFGMVAFSALPADAASFDCGQAKAPDEIAICTHSKLSALDSEMGGLWFAYSRIPMLMGANGNRHDEADAFLKKREACGRDVACLTTLYDARIKTLQGEITTTLKQFNSCL